LIKKNADNVEFQIIDENLLGICMKFLNKNINQVGFHQLYKPVKKLGKGGFATVY
jgi:membrane protease subunit (stomatin/prohibitin family)